MRGPHVPGSPGRRKEASSSRGTSLGTGASGPTGRSPQPTLPGLPQGRPGSRSRRQGRSRFWAASRRSTLRRVLCGPAVLLATRWNETTRFGSAPARTTVWPPEQGTQPPGAQLRRICYLAQLCRGCSRTSHFGPRLRALR